MPNYQRNEDLKPHYDLHEDYSLSKLTCFPQVVYLIKVLFISKIHIIFIRLLCLCLLGAKFLL